MGDHPIDIAINSEDESSKPCIFKVPDILRRHSPKSFTPNSFSIGPIHYKKKYLKEQKKAEKIKQHYLNNLLTRKPTPQTTLEDFKRSILEVEEKARQCYDVTFDHPSKDEFVHMLVLDGCFIIELLRNNEIATKKNENNSNNNNNNKNNNNRSSSSNNRSSNNNNNNNRSSNNNNKNNNNRSSNNNNNRSSNNNNNNNRSSNNNNTTIDEDDPVFSVSWVLQVLYHDLILLENQIPWFVLVRLFDMTSQTIPSSTKSLTELALGFLRINLSKCPLPEIEGSHESKHILDLLRSAIVSSFETGQGSTGDWQLIPTATTLKKSGITFKKRNSSNLLAIKFAKHGVLEIPPLLIQETTCQAFRNLVSYEQCYPNCESMITSYVVLLNNLINTTEDINMLREVGIVDNWLNPYDTVKFFKNIYTDTCVKKFYYVEICQEVNKYTERFWPTARAAVVRSLFYNPLIIVSEIVASIALILTFLQTWYSLLDYKRDSSSSPPR